MPQQIQRVGPIPEFYELLITQSLVPESNMPVGRNIFYQTQRWIYIPNYQRGVSWTTSFIDDSFLKSQSPLMGNLVLANWAIDGTQDPNDWKNQLINGNQRDFFHLLDGLQRFSTGTIILNALHNLIWSTGAKFSIYAQNVEILKNQIGNRDIVYLHNHYEFLNHPRLAISSQYSQLFEEYTESLKTLLGCNNQSLKLEYLESINDLFLNKQVAVDAFHGFTSMSQVMNVFLGVNTVRIELNEIDLIRSYIVEHATFAGWLKPDIENIENRFNSVFISKGKPKLILKPFSTLLLEAIQKDWAHKFFPSYNQGFDLAEVTRFLTFIERFENYSQKGFIEEIKFYDNPYCALICFYYERYLTTGSLPAFLQGNGMPSFTEVKELYLLYRAMIRTIIYRKVGKVRDKVCYKIMKDPTSFNMNQIADFISQIVIDGDMNKDLDQTAVSLELREMSNKPAQRIFNALLLSEIGNPINFEPITFGNRAQEFHIDHLIPKSQLRKGQRGYKEGDKIGNFAPIPYKDNISAQMTDCSDKIGTRGLYNKAEITIIPFNHFLIHNHAPSLPDITNLNTQRLLSNNIPESTADQRIAYIAENLVSRI